MGWDALRIDGRATFGLFGQALFSMRFAGQSAGFVIHTREPVLIRRRRATGPEALTP